MSSRTSPPTVALSLLLALAACGGPERERAESSPGSPSASAPEPSLASSTEPTMTTPPDDASTADRVSEAPQTVQKTEAEWRAQLTPEEFRVARQAGTERAFTGRYWNTTTPGTYVCVCCKTPLFRSDAKFESGCGWPSFFEPLEGANLIELRDTTLGMVRTEVRCKTCDAHLGHVFPDGPPPTGLRYCINSVSLLLDADEEE